MRRSPHARRAERRGVDGRRAQEPIALYVRIASVLRGKILRGEWPLHHMLPSVSALTRACGAARATAVQALQSLVDEGLVASERGRGSCLIDEGRLVNAASNICRGDRFRQDRTMAGDEAGVPSAGRAGR